MEYSIIGEQILESYPNIKLHEIYKQNLLLHKSIKISISV